MASVMFKVMRGQETSAMFKVMGGGDLRQPF